MFDLVKHILAPAHRFVVYPSPWPLCPSYIFQCPIRSSGLRTVISRTIILLYSFASRLSGDPLKKPPGSGGKGPVRTDTQSSVPAGRIAGSKSLYLTFENPIFVIQIREHWTSQSEVQYSFCAGSPLQYEYP